MLFKFSDELADLGFEDLKIKKLTLEGSLTPEKIFERLNISDLRAILSLMGSNSDDTDLSELLIEPAKLIKVLGGCI